MNARIARHAALFGLFVLAGGIMRADDPRTEPFVYREDFETGELRAWASYPPNQDTAYDPYVYPGRLRPDDPGFALIVKCEPPWPKPQTIGAIKRLNLLFDRDSSLTFRCRLKSVAPASRLTIHLSFADGRRLRVPLPPPSREEWRTVELDGREIAARGVGQDGERRDGDWPLPLTAVAVTVDVPDADPETPFFLALDDFVIRGRRDKSFAFLEPEVTVLREWPERIPLRHYKPGAELVLRGSYDFEAPKVELKIRAFSGSGDPIFETPLKRESAGSWTARVRLDPARFPAGLYRGAIAALDGGRASGLTTFTFFVIDAARTARRPRVLVPPGGLAAFRERLAGARFKPVLDRWLEKARGHRAKLDPASVVFDIDQFPARDWIPSLPAWYTDRIMAWREALLANAVAHASGRDPEAGPYTRALLLRVAALPSWNHPWMEARGFHTYYPLGELADAFASAYDLVHDLLDEDDRLTVREGLLRNFVRPAFRTYVENDQVTSASSNWISHIAGGGIVALASLYGDDAAAGDLEPWLTGFILKLDLYLRTVFGADGSYGEGFRYYNFAMQSLGRSLPALDDVFRVDLSGPVRTSYLETLWASQPRRNRAFSFGDTESYLKKEAQAWWIGTENGPMNNWAWLLSRTRDPYLAWLYGTLKEFDTLQEVVFPAEDVPASDPAGLGTVKFFREVGTAVFRSGWSDDDFLFVFRSGPFYNHQHLDQGSFFLVDRGEVFLEERYDGEHRYYDDPLYRTHAIQPVSHNTLLLDGNPQSQRVGDPAGFAAGLADHARLARALDAGAFALATGDLTAVYGEAVRRVRRHVVFLKPRTILLVDEVETSGSDADVSLLFNAVWKKDWRLEDAGSLVAKGARTLRLVPLGPQDLRREVVEDPHFLYQYAAKPLVPRGHLRVTGRTANGRFVAAHLLGTGLAPGANPLPAGRSSDGVYIARVHTEAGGEVDIAVAAGGRARLGSVETDALILARSPEGEILLVEGRTLLEDGTETLSLTAAGSVALVREAGQIRLVFDAPAGTRAEVRVKTRPESVRIGGRAVDAAWNPARNAVAFVLPAGRGEAVLRLPGNKELP
jgi:hypothetical protein